MSWGLDIRNSPIRQCLCSYFNYISCMEMVILIILKANEIAQQSWRLMWGAACLELIGELCLQVTLSEVGEDRNRPNEPSETSFSRATSVSLLKTSLQCSCPADPENQWASPHEYNSRARGTMSSDTAWDISPLPQNVINRQVQCFQIREVQCFQIILKE